MLDHAIAFFRSLVRSLVHSLVGRSNDLADSYLYCVYYMNVCSSWFFCATIKGFGTTTTFVTSTVVTTFATIQHHDDVIFLYPRTISIILIMFILSNRHTFSLHTLLVFQLRNSYDAFMLIFLRINISACRVVSVCLSYVYVCVCVRVVCVFFITSY